jgi:orotidine-5'-phosphate decarboxylase
MEKDNRDAQALLAGAIESQESLVCCGLDPDFTRIPLEIKTKTCPPAEKALAFLHEVVDATVPYVCAYKIQKAFFEPLPGGHEAMRSVITYIHRCHPEIPVFLDCKIGDIGNTMKAYLHTAFDLLNVDGLVVNPYMGDDVLRPFATLPEKTALVLVRTSNPGADVVQEIRGLDGRPLWKHVLDLVVHRWNTAGSLMPVLSVSNDQPDPLRKSIPDDMIVFAAGYGAQGGTAVGVGPLLNSGGAGVVVNSSRALLYPLGIDGPEWRSAIRAAAMEMRDEINQQRKAPPAGPQISGIVDR